MKNVEERRPSEGEENFLLGIPSIVQVLDQYAKQNLGIPSPPILCSSSLHFG